MGLGTRIAQSAAGLGILLAFAAAPVSAATQIIVTPTNTQGWSTADTRPGGAVTFVADPTAPGAPHTGALKLRTDLTDAAKAQYLHAANTPLASITALSYYTKQNAAIFPGGDPSYQVITYLNGGTSGFSTLVFESYQNAGNNGNAAVVPGAWQKWDVKAGLFWSTRTVVCSGGTVVGTSGGPAIYTLAQISSVCPNAIVAGFGVNIGSNNPGYNVETDLFNFNGTVYNFEPFNTPTSKDQCKHDGFRSLTDANGQAFKNQGQCEKYVNSTTEKNDSEDDDEGHDDD